jgi:hypothetical protein
MITEKDGDCKIEYLDNSIEYLDNSIIIKKDGYEIKYLNKFNEFTVIPMKNKCEHINYISKIKNIDGKYWHVENDKINTLLEAAVYALEFILDENQNYWEKNFKKPFDDIPFMVTHYYKSGRHEFDYSEYFFVGRYVEQPEICYI